MIVWLVVWTAVTLGVITPQLATVFVHFQSHSSAILLKLFQRVSSCTISENLTFFGGIEKNLDKILIKSVTKMPDSRQDFQERSHWANLFSSCEEIACHEMFWICSGNLPRFSAKLSKFKTIKIVRVRGLLYFSLFYTNFDTSFVIDSQSWRHWKLQPVNLYFFFDCVQRDDHGHGSTTMGSQLGFYF